ncbi:MAG: hypothetical protein U0166_05705 [Acidobacteriota bacterium]
MWRFRHLIVALSIVAIGYYLSITFRADVKVIVVLMVLMGIVYVAASLADPPEKPPKAT